MSKHTSAQMTYDEDPVTVYAMLVDPAYVREKNERTGGRDVKVEVTTQGKGCRIVATRTLPADLPAFAKKFLGETLTTTETDVWNEPNPDGSRDATIAIDFHGAPVTLNGKLRLEATATGAVCKVEVEVKASIPLISGKIEGVAQEQFQRAVDAENPIGVEWLAR